MSYRDQVLSFVAGGVYIPRRDPFTGKSILFHTQSLEVRHRHPGVGLTELTSFTTDPSLCGAADPAQAQSVCPVYR